MMIRSMLLSSAISIVLCGACVSAGPATQLVAEDAYRIPGVPSVTVQELNEGLEKAGYDPAVIGRQIAFDAVITHSGSAGGPLQVRIEGMKAGRLDKAYLFRELGFAEGLEVGDPIKVHGMLVGQAYGVWQVWVRWLEWRPAGLAPARPERKTPTVMKALQLADMHVRREQIDTTKMEVASATLHPDAERPHWAVTWRTTEKDVKGGWFTVRVYGDQTTGATFGE